MTGGGNVTSRLRLIMKSTKNAKIAFLNSEPSEIIEETYPVSEFNAITGFAKSLKVGGTFQSISYNRE